jgi:hypothetical protein
MSRWRLIRPRAWSPLHLEEIYYRPPDGGHVRTGRCLIGQARPDRHLVAVGRRTWLADARDVFPREDWQRERELTAMEEE